MFHVELFSYSSSSLLVILSVPVHSRLCSVFDLAAGASFDWAATVREEN